MEQGNNYTYLQELSKSDFQIVGGEPTILGWKVRNEIGTYLGEVKELLFDPDTKSVRYVVIDLTRNDMHLAAKKVMLPIGLAHLHVSDDEVVLPNIHTDQFNALPTYQFNTIGPETEVHIRTVIGSQAGSQPEGTGNEFNQKEFYAHPHFNKEKLYRQGTSSNDLTEENTFPDQTAEQGTVSQSEASTINNPLTRGI